jgi:hypothetical protein
MPERPRVRAAAARVEVRVFIEGVFLVRGIS